MKKKLPKIIVVCGPTGSGKTALAVSLCKKFNGEIVNADSRQVYREMDIGTAKNLDVNPKSQIPNPKQTQNSKSQTIQGVPVHLVNIVDPNERYNVGQFKKDAEVAIADIISRGKVPFVVGGTGLYIDALVENFQLPEENNKNISVGARSPRPDLGGGTPPLQELIKDLNKFDSEALSIVDLKNRRRVERAIEYCLTTGKKFSESRKKGERKYTVLKLSPAVSLDREKLYEKINKRVEEMIEEGLEKEVKTLAEKYGWDSEAMTGIGYREWREYFSVGTRHALSLQNVIDQIKQDSRNYAKRQITWFKRPARNALACEADGDKEINWVCPNSGGAEKLVKEFLTI